MRKTRIDHVEELTHPATCPECGKDFEIRFPKEYAYKRIKDHRMKYWCSYHCFQAMKRQKRRRRTTWLNVE